MSPRRRLPPHLPLAFTVGNARALGVGRSRLDGDDLERPFHGVRLLRPIDVPQAPVSAEEFRAELLLLARCYAARMRPDEFFSHTTAALIWSLPLPPLTATHLHVSVLRPGRAPRSAGVCGHQVDPRLAHVTELGGFRLATPATTWAALGTMLGPYDLVAAGDAIVCTKRPAGSTRAFAPQPLATLDQLAAAIDAGRRPGVSALRDAFGRIRTGSWSRLETWVRLILVDAGLPEPTLNFNAYDDEGRFLACVDLAYPDLKIAIEYEGDHHRTDPVQFQRDIDRLERLTENGWRIVRLVKGHIFRDTAEVVRRVSVARAQRSPGR